MSKMQAYKNQWSEVQLVNRFLLLCWTETLEEQVSFQTHLHTHECRGLWLETYVNLTYKSGWLANEVVKAVGEAFHCPPLKVQMRPVMNTSPGSEVCSVSAWELRVPVTDALIKAYKAWHKSQPKTQEKSKRK